MEDVKKLDVAATSDLIATHFQYSERYVKLIKERFSACQIDGQRFSRLTRDDLGEIFPGDLHFGLRQDIHSFINSVKNGSEADDAKVSVSPSPTPCNSQSSDTDSVDHEEESPEIPQLPTPLRRRDAVYIPSSSSGSETDTTATPKELGSNFTLPKFFGPGLDRKLKQENTQLTKKEFNAVIDILRSHVWVVCSNPTLKTRKWIAKAMCKEYPALALQHPYLSMAKKGLEVPREVNNFNFQPELEVLKKLTRAFENKRQNLKKRFQDTSETTTTDEEAGDGLCTESPQAIERHHKMLLKSMESAGCEDLIEDLMIRSFEKRKDVIATFPGNKRVVMALKKYPPMMNAKQLCLDMMMCLGRKPDENNIANCEENFKNHANKLVCLMESDNIPVEMANKDEIELTAITNLTKVFATKRKCRVNQQFHMTQTDKESFKTSTPYLLVTKEEVIVMGNSDTPVTSFCRKVAVSKAVVCLLAVYYSFDLEYPLQAANAYAFLDEFVLNTDPENNSSHYSSMVSKYAKFLSKS